MLNALAHGVAPLSSRLVALPALSAHTDGQLDDLGPDDRHAGQVLGAGPGPARSACAETPVSPPRVAYAGEVGLMICAGQLLGAGPGPARTACAETPVSLACVAYAGQARLIICTRTHWAAGHDSPTVLKYLYMWSMVWGSTPDLGVAGHTAMLHVRACCLYPIGANF